MSTTDEVLRFHEGPWTEDDYFALPEDRSRVELVDGSLVVNPGPDVRHQRLSSRLCWALEKLRPDGMESLEAVNVRVGPGRILIPDLVVVGRQPIDAAVVDARDVLVAIEIVSPGSVAADRAIKPPLYAAAGVPTYVRVEPSGGEPAAITFHLGGGRYVPADGDLGDHILRLTQPFRAEIDLAGLLAAKRPTPTGSA